MRALPLSLLTLLGAASATLDAEYPQVPLVAQDRTPDVSPEAPYSSTMRDELLALHRSLVEIESETLYETHVGDWLADYLEARGYTVQRQHMPVRSPGAGEARFNIIAWPGKTGRPQPRVIVSSHIDAVPPHIPYAISDEHPTAETVIRGRGSVDAKGSVAAQIVAVQSLLDGGAVDEADVALLFVVGEEGPGDGMRFFSESAERRALGGFEAVIFGEPTQNKLACGHKGGLFCSVEARGVAGHSGYPWLGKSANELLVRAMYALATTDLGSSDRFGNTTVNIGRFYGGVAINVIPEHAKADLAVRVAIGPEDEGGLIVAERIRGILAGIDPEAFTLEYTHAYGVVESDCTAPGFETTVESYGTDMPNLKGDYTRYLYGPGSILVAHGPTESLTVGDLETAVDGFKRLILHALRK
ncbi:unnamed protein product [Parascedosporium putredinis]|uniref:Peptidase M20 dimerisation domain-containing protein n=1 Tax=Parascedosporium putredinis TaxID=1442378 RepID=A0A9P1H6B7_9PEZI|nr:unnamed protein product [Parascedosporium putredinis]CAI7997393.1 unnamed protein product [Parascedosporium putredinis]